MDEDQIRRLRRAGMLIGSHGCSHGYLSDMPPQDARRELAESKARLESILQEPVPALALPGDAAPATLNVWSVRPVIGIYSLPRSAWPTPAAILELASHPDDKPSG